MPSSRTVLVGTAALCAAGLVGYAVYFDYKRRNDLEFRKRLRKEHKKVSSKRTRDKLAEPVQAALSNDDLRTALTQLKSEPIPSSQIEREQYLLTYLGTGERLAAQGPAHRLEAALCFYRALRVAPGAASVNFFQVIESTQPPEVFKLLMEIVSLDVKARVEGYFDHFPASDMNVKTSTKEIVGPESASGRKFVKRILITDKDFKAGEIIFTENPAVATLDPDLISSGTHCAQCMRVIVPGLSLPAEGELLPTSYCSRECQTTARTKYSKLLFTLEPPVPEVASEITAKMTSGRKKGQEEFIKFLQDDNAKFPSYTYLTAQFIAIYLMDELAMVTSASPKSPFASDSADDYTLSDHFERLRYLELTNLEEQYKLVNEIFEHAMPGLEQFLTLDRFCTLMGKMAYNAYGVSYSGGRDDKPESPSRPEEQEKTRTPYGTRKQIGSGLFLTSSYLTHSCNPNARVSFQEGTSKLHLIAVRDVKEGEELSVSFVDTTQKEDESVVESRRRRRMEIARGWKIACPCDRCTEEAPAEDKANGIQPIQDGSKAEEMIQRFEDGITGGSSESPLD